MVNASHDQEVTCGTAIAEMLKVEVDDVLGDI